MDLRFDSRDYLSTRVFTDDWYHPTGTNIDEYEDDSDHKKMDAEKNNCAVFVAWMAEKLKVKQPDVGDYRLAEA
ncbi:Uu.00g057380.m01.CDS01 [Anthostomella pinea]|uniref:Uu.00g057380.m01.CDS01 n=1 Tax=Anthostomella pinea TaxID=933095 RepID=A0AAI8VSJ5_9PEZI|nr:Uu.00g057380.m01.CDS01 [Anthostomella pinea]